MYVIFRQRGLPFFECTVGKSCFNGSTSYVYAQVTALQGAAAKEYSSTVACTASVRYNPRNLADTYRLLIILPDFLNEFRPCPYSTQKKVILFKDYFGE